ncbi:MAG: tRNA lysidine(34) synthetase TilS [bacterium]
MNGSLFLRDIAGRIKGLMAQAEPSRPGAGLLVALSGGPDSVALLLGAREWALAGGNPLEAVHLDHALRGEESAGDRDFCRRLCGDLGIPLHEHRRDPRPVARSRGLGLEEAGRHLRLGLFTEILDRSERLHAVATGHHADDQAETVLMRLFRGTGPAGLTGMQAREGRLIRPLLEIRRRDLVAGLEALGQVWRIDASNETGDNLRARMRRELIPLVDDLFGQGCHRNPARVADLLGRDLAFLDRLTAEKLARIGGGGNGDSLDVPGLLGLDPVLAARVVHRWLHDTEQRPPAGGKEPDGAGLVHVQAILDWLRKGQSGTGLDLPGGRRIRRDFDLIRLETVSGGTAPLRPASDYRILVATHPGGVDPLDLGRAEGPGEARGPDEWRLTCPAGCLRGNIQVRNPRPGDRLQPFGLAGSKKLSDLLQEKKVPADRRGSVLVVADAGGVLWVVGLARAERTRLLPDTDRMVTISVSRRMDNPTQGN